MPTDGSPPRRRPAQGGRPAGPPRSERTSRGSSSGAGRRDGAQPAERRGRGTRPSARDGERTTRPAEPPLPEDADAALLDRAARAGLRSLPESLADRIALHLVAAGQLLDDDPAAADAHARYARRLAPRLAVVREAAALTAYRTGDYATALAEFRALRRMTGDPSYLPVMADCERGLGRPERAIALGRDADTARLDPAARIELAIVISGARRDRDEPQAAVAALRPLVASKAVRPWTARLWYAYAAALADTGQLAEALSWFASVAAIDDEGETDAEQRLAELEQSEPDEALRPPHPDPQSPPAS